MALALLASLPAPAALAQRLLGLDISAHQGNISQTTWNNFHNVENRDFVFIRSSRGGTTGEDHRQGGYPSSDNDFFNLSQRYDDLYFVQNINRATTAGMFAGPYHRSRADVIATTLNSDGVTTAGVANSGADDANHMIQMARAWMRPGYLPPVLDFEDGIEFRTDQEMAQFALDFSNRMYEVMGIRPAIYINGNYAQNSLAGGTATQRSQLAQQSSNPPSVVSPAFPTLWSARWPNQADPNSIDVQNENPTIGFSNIYGPWDDYGVTHPWAFWQYASTGRLQSFNNGGQNLDFDVSHGDTEYVKDQLIPALWLNNTSGDWSTLANWNSGQTPVAPVVSPGQLARVGPLTMPTPRLPGAAGSGVTSGQHDTVILERPNANITVTLSSGSHNIRKLYMRETLNISGGSLTVNYNPDYVSDTVNYPNALRSGPISAQFSGPVTLSDGSLSVHTLQVDATRTFTLGGGTLTFNRINLMPGATPAKMLVSGDVNLNPLSNAAAVIANGAGAGSSGLIDLGGANRTFNVGNGTAGVDLSISVPVTNGGLTKAGPGALALSGVNTYAGDTIVQSGKLTTTSAFLANAADVYISTGATLDLNFTGAADVIDSLFVEGVSQLAGTWGAVGSGTEFTSPLITGTGMLQVTTFVAPLAGDFNGDGMVDGLDLAAWRTHAGMASGAETSDGDADNDADVDGADFLTWQQNLGASQAAPSAAAVPEPTGALLLALGALVACRRRAV